jgi:stage III sporulation protein AG
MNQIAKIFANKNIALVLYAVIAAGIVFMLLPHSGGDAAAVGDSADNKEVSEEVNRDDMRKELEQVLGMVEGAGEVRVMITYKNNGSMVIAENKADEESVDKEDSKQSHQTTVVFNNEGKPVVLSEAMPGIEGVVIVAQGGGNIQVKDSLIRAAQALLGVEPNKVEVLKMKTEG